jgi:hypothetical protein
MTILCHEDYIMHNHFKIQASSVLCGNGVRPVICDNFKIQASCVFWDNAVRPVICQDWHFNYM